MKIKIFKGLASQANDPQNIEDKVNQFIKDKDIVDIKHALATPDGSGGMIFASLIVMYNE
jgi:ATP phosphoribosyltransferase regulatory subunit HisZ